MRITTLLQNDLYQQKLQQNEKAQSQAANKLAEQKKVLTPSDDPQAYSVGQQYDSALDHLKVYQKNITNLHDQLQLQSSHTQAMTDVLIKIRTLAVQASNGTYTQGDMHNIATQVESGLNTLVSTANSQDGQGRYLFAGDHWHTQPFQVIHNSQGPYKNWVEQVRYQGNNDNHSVQVNNLTYIQDNSIGDRVFWAGKSPIDNTKAINYYRNPQQATITVDGHNISISKGATAQQVVDAINHSKADITASISSGQTIQLSPNTPHQIWLSDKSGSVLQDLGLINQQSAPYNLSNKTTEPQSIFSVVINLRNAMESGNHKQVAKILSQLDQCIDHCSDQLSTMGAKMHRLNTLNSQLGEQKINWMKFRGQQTGLDLSKAILDYKQWQFSYSSLLELVNHNFNTNILNYLK